MRKKNQQLEQDESLEPSIIAPVKGLNTRSAVAGLLPGFCITADDVICQPDAVIMRTGAANHKTGFVSTPKTLMKYGGLSANFMFAAADDGIFDCTAAGTVGAAVAAITNGECRWKNFSTSAGSYLVICNGTDAVWNFNGTVWSNPAITVATSANLTAVETYRHRLYFIEKAKLSFWYMPVDSIAGAAAEFRIGSLCERGGYAMGMGTWTIDGGNGPDDYFCVATSEGEIAIFTGSDPSDATNWLHKGTFYIGKPLSRNCFVKQGADLLFLSNSGVFPLSKALRTAGKDFQDSVSRNIEPTIVALGRTYPLSQVWQVIPLPLLSLLLVNVPTVPATQYIMCTITGAWSRFAGSWPATSFLEYDGAVYFSMAAKIAKCFTGTSDFGANISGVVDTAYLRFGTNRQLHPSMFRPTMSATGLFNLSLGFSVDFDTVYNEQSYIQSLSAVGVWDSGLWDVALWGGTFYLVKDWRTVSARPGNSLSIRIRMTSNVSTAALLVMDLKMAKLGLIS